MAEKHYSSDIIEKDGKFTGHLFEDGQQFHAKDHEKPELRGQPKEAEPIFTVTDADLGIVQEALAKELTRLKPAPEAVKPVTREEINARVAKLNAEREAKENPQPLTKQSDIPKAVQAKVPAFESGPDAIRKTVTKPAEAEESND